MPRTLRAIISIVIFQCTIGCAAESTITTIAGNGEAGFSGDGGPAIDASLHFTWSTKNSIAGDLNGNFYIADVRNLRVRKVDTNGNISTVAGNGNPGVPTEDIAAVDSAFVVPHAIAVDAAGTLYIADCGVARIYYVDGNGILRLFAGGGNGGDGGLAIDAELQLWSFFPGSMCFDSAGNLYFCEAGNNAVRKVDTAGFISTVAGGTFGDSGDGDLATLASLKTPSSLAIDPSGNLYIGSLSNRIRRVDSVTSIIDSYVQINPDYSDPCLAIDYAGNLLFSERGRVLKVDAVTQAVTLVAGNGSRGFAGDGGPPQDASIGYINGMCVIAGGEILIADQWARRIRKFADPQLLPPDNYPPVAFNQAVSTAMNTPVDIFLLASDEEADPLTYLIIMPPAHGDIVLAGDTVTYTPNSNYNGVDSFSFIACQASGNSNLATVTVSIGDSIMTFYGGARGINNLGEVVGISHDTLRGFRWNANGVTDLTYNGDTTGAVSINDLGQIAGYSAGVQACLWNNSVEGTLLNTLGGNYAVANAINNNGRIVGFAYYANSTHAACFWEAGNPNPTPLAGEGANANGLNSFGDTVGEFTNGDRCACLWPINSNDPLPVELRGFGNGGYDTAIAINDTGTVMGYATILDVIGRAVLWESATAAPVDLGTLGGSTTYARSMNNSMAVVGASTLAPGSWATHAFLWSTQTGMIDLNGWLPPGSPLELLEATGINDQGQICGNALYMGYAPVCFVLNGPSNLSANPNAPIAYDQRISIDVNQPAEITLQALDVNNDDLIYTIVAPPQYGTGELSGATVTYTPNQDFRGIDRFTFKVNDGQYDSNIGTITVFTGVSITELGDYVDAYDINNLGQVVGTNDTDGFLQDNGATMALAPFEDGHLAFPLSINEQSQIVGFSYLPDFMSWHACIWDSNGMPRDLGTLGGANSDARAINNTSIAVGRAFDQYGQLHPCYWANVVASEPPIPLTSPDYTSGQANAINSVNMAAGDAYMIDGYNRAMIWQLNTGRPFGFSLGLLAGTSYASASGINDAGQIVGYCSNGMEQFPCLWPDCHSPPVSLAAEATGFATAINNSGVVVGYRYMSSAFVWTKELGLVNLDNFLPLNSGWALARANSINENGQVCGAGLHNGEWRTYVLDLGTFGSAQPNAIITSPSDGAVYLEGQTVAVTVDASAAEGSVTRVELLVNGSVVDSKTAAPFTFEVSGLALGQYYLAARVFDDRGGRALSRIVEIIVDEPPYIITGPLVSGFESPRTFLQVVAGDNNGEENLTYTWTITGPAGQNLPVTPNGLNSTSDIAFVFPIPGIYQVSVHVSDSSGLYVEAGFAPTMTTEVFKNLMPAPGAWVNVRRPNISGDVVDPWINIYSLGIEISYVPENDDLPPVAGIVARITDLHFEAIMPIDLVDGEYQVCINAIGEGGIPAAYVWNFKVDATRPTVAMPPQLSTYDTFPELTADLHDDLSGIDGNSITATLTNLTTQDVLVCTVAFDGTTATFSLPEVLSFFTYRLDVNVADIAGNTHCAHMTLVILDTAIDLSAPQIDTVSPGNPQFLKELPVVIQISYHDEPENVENSGIDPASAKLHINGALVTPTTANETEMTYTLPAGSADGLYSWTFTVEDTDGNRSAPVSGKFTLDTHEPVVEFSDAILDAAQAATVQFELSDAVSGVKWDTLIIHVNGELCTNYYHVGASVIVELPSPVYGPRVVDVEVMDVAENSWHEPHTQVFALYGIELVAPSADNFDAFDLVLPSLTPEPETYEFLIHYAEGLDLGTLAITYGAHDATIFARDEVARTAKFAIATDVTDPFMPMTFSITELEAIGSFTYVFNGILSKAAVTPGAPEVTWYPEDDAQNVSPGTEITFYVNSGRNPPVVPLKRYQLTVNGVVVRDEEFGQNDGYESKTYHHPGGFHNGVVTAAVTVWDIRDQYANEPLSFTVADVTGPTVTVDLPGPTSKSKAFRFSAESGGFAVDYAFAELHYEINSDPLLIFDVEPMYLITHWNYVIPQNLNHGDLVTYTINVRDTEHNPGAANGSFIYDSAGPVIDILTNTINTGTPYIEFSVSDTLSGLRVPAATLTKLGDTTVELDCDEDGHWKASLLTVTLLEQHGYILTVTAEDEVGNTSVMEKEYFIGDEDTTDPIIEITPPVVGSYDFAIEVSDSGTGVLPEDIVITPNSLVITSTQVDPVTRNVLIDGRFPYGLTGMQSITVDATDGNDNQKIVTNQITLNVQAPAPIVSYTTAGIYYVTLNGIFPAESAVPLSSITATADGATVNSIHIDLSQREWRVVLKKTGPLNFTYSLRYLDAYGIAGLSLNSQTLFEDITDENTPPIPSNHPPTPAPENSLEVDPGVELAVFWDFKPEEIIGITLPDSTPGDQGTDYNIVDDGENGEGEIVETDQKNIQKRGWVPAVNKENCKVLIIINGGAPPYKAHLEGENIDAADFDIAGHRQEIEIELKEGLCRNLKFTVTDFEGSTGRSFSRSIFCDTLKPEQPALGGDAKWKWSYNDYSQPYEAIRLFGDTLNGSFEVDTDDFTMRDEIANFDNLEKRGSGIARIEYQFSEEEGAERFSVTRRDYRWRVRPHRWYPEDFNSNASPYSPFEKDDWLAFIPPPPTEGDEDVVQKPFKIWDGEKHGGEPFPYRWDSMIVRVYDAAGNTPDDPLRGYLAYEESHLGFEFPRQIPVGRMVVLRDGINNPDGSGYTKTYTVQKQDEITFEDYDYALIQFDKPGVFEVVEEINYDDPEVDPVTIKFRVLVFKPEFIVDENNNDDTTDENQLRQTNNGVIVPINDRFDLNGTADDYWKPDFAVEAATDSNLRLVTFDKNIPETYVDHYDTKRPYWGKVSLVHSPGVRLWRTRQKNPEDLIDPDVHPSDHSDGNTYNARTREWDLLDEDQRKDFASLDGKVYVECLPGNDTDPDNFIWYAPRAYDWNLQPQYIALNLDRGTCAIHVPIIGVSDNNGGMRDGQAVFQVADNAVVDLTCGALRMNWLMARTESNIIPPIRLYYDSRDGVPGKTNSRFTHDGGLLPDEDALLSDAGPRFWHTLSMRLLRGDQVLYLFDQDGTQTCFRPVDLEKLSEDEKDAVWIPAALDTANADRLANPHGENSKIKVVTQTHYGRKQQYYVLLRDGENKQYLFEKETCKLKEIRDVYDNVATLEYAEYGGTRGRLVRVSDNRGFFVEFDGNGRDWLDVTDMSGKTTSRLENGIFGPYGSYDFTLNPNKRIVAFTNARGAWYTINPDTGFEDESTDFKFPKVDPYAYFDPLKYSLSKTFGVVYKIQRDVDSRTLEIEYEPNSAATVTYYKAGNEDPEYDYAYDAQRGHWTHCVLPGDAGEMTQTASDTGFITQRMNPANGVWVFTESSDLPGWTSSVLDPDGNTTKRTPTALASLHAGEGGGGGEGGEGGGEEEEKPEPRNYLEHIWVIGSSENASGTTSYAYEAGRLESVSVPGGGTTIFSSYDPFGQPRNISRSDGYQRELEYDDGGYLIFTIESDGNGSFTDLVKCDIWGQVREICQDDGRLVLKEYDAFGRLLTTRGPLVTALEAGQINDGGTSGVFYDKLGMWSKILYRDGTSVDRQFNDLGAVTKQIARGGAETTFDKFDPYFNPGEAVSPEIGNGADQLKTEYVYDALGRQRVERLPGGGNILTDIINGGKTVEVTSPGGLVTKHTLTDAGRLANSKNAAGMTVSQYYDGNGNVTARQASGFATETYARQELGLVKTQGFEYTGLESELEYDINGQLSSATRPGGITQNFDVDSFGRLHETRLNGVAVQTLSYEGGGVYRFAPKQVTDALTNASVERSIMDANYQPKTLTVHQSGGLEGLQISGVENFQTAGDFNRTATYRGNGELLTLDSGVHTGTKVEHHYNNAGRYCGTTDMHGVGTVAVYSPAGAVLSVQDETGNLTNYIYYSDTGLLKAIKHADDSGKVFEYDEDRNIKKVTHATNISEEGSPGGYTATYQYKYVLGQLTSIIDPAGKKTQIGYHAKSPLVKQVTDPDGRATQYFYDAAGRYDRVVAPDQRVTKYQYHANGQVEQVDYANGRRAKYTYVSSGLNRGKLASQTITGQGTTQYGYDARGDLTTITLAEITPNVPNTVITLEYDNQHRVYRATLPGGKTIDKAYNNEGHLIYMKDPAGNEFAMETWPNGLKKRLFQVSNAGGRHGEPIGGEYNWQGYLPLSDGTLTWDRDERGRITSCGGAAYEYNNPLGLCTSKTFAGITQLFDYTDNGYLREVREGSRKVTFDHSDGGRLQSAAYSNGMSLTYQYNKDFVSQIKYAKNGTTLAQIDATFYPTGNRKTLEVMVQGSGTKTYQYQYDSAQFLTQEINDGGTFNYSYDEVGNRLTKTGGGIADTYVYDVEHRLDHIAHADATRTNFTYDGNGNVTSKHRAKTQAINIGYRNTSQADRQCTLNIDGVDVGKVIFTPNEVYTTVTKSIHGGETISLVIRADDVEATSSPLYIDYLGISATGFEAEDAALYGNVNVFEDETASQEHAVCQFGETTGDAIVFTGLPVPVPERYTYTWDNLNRMTTAKSYIGSEAEPRDEAAFHYNGAGWEILSQTINAVDKTFSYGAGGELLTETVANFGTRTYINAGLDNVLWSNDNQGTMYWLNDLNGTNYGLTDASGGILERQIYDGFGNKQLTYPNGDPRSASGYNNDVGFQGRGGASWIGANFRNRWYDPQVGRFFSRDPLGLVDGGGVYVGFGGNPVNNIDPMGTDYITINDGKVSYQGTGWFGCDSGDPIIIGTEKNGTISISAAFGGSAVSVQALSRMAKGINRGAATKATVQNVIGRARSADWIAANGDARRIFHGYHQFVERSDAESYYTGSPSGYTSHEPTREEQLEDEVARSLASKRIDAWIQKNTIKYYEEHMDEALETRACEALLNTFMPLAAINAGATNSRTSIPSASLVPKTSLDPYASRHAWITSRLRVHLDQAVSQARLSPEQLRDIAKNGKASRHWGTQIDTTFKSLVQNDPLLQGEVAVSPRSLSKGTAAPDIVDLRAKTWWDATTQKAWKDHVRQYELQYGQGTGLLYDKK